MQISKTPRANQGQGRGGMLPYIAIGVLLFLAFDFHQGGSSFELYEDFVSPGKDTVRGGGLPPEALEVLAEREGMATAQVGLAQEKPHKTRHDFIEIGKKAGTDKVAGYERLPECLADDKSCLNPEYENERCRVWGHFYDTIYERWLGPYTERNIPFQFLEIGYYTGHGYETYTKFLSGNPSAELHAMEISCIEEGPRDEGKWPWGNFAKKHSWYQRLLNADRLHCGDASDFGFLNKIWTTKMKRPDAPPLKVVIDDGSHLHDHMATTLFYWFPRIEPGGILVVEDIQPISMANKFRTHILPQAMKDLHWCGGGRTEKNTEIEDSRCFPTIQPLLQGIHCEMHICVFVRNDKPAVELDEASSRTPQSAFANPPKCLFGPHN